jgi:hypothetical protein
MNPACKEEDMEQGGYRQAGAVEYLKACKDLAV